MRIRYGVCFLLAAILGFAMVPLPLEAHSGSVGQDHCHFCYDSCEPHGLKWGQRHCHPDRQPGIPASIDATPGHTQIVPRPKESVAKPSAPQPAARPYHAAVLPPVLPDVFSAQVVDISAGDTFTVRDERGKHRIELYGVAAPHKGQPLAKQAKRFTKEQIHKKTVTIIPKAFKAGSVLSAQVILPDGQNLSHVLLEKGLARWDVRTTDEAVLSQLERTARTEQRGLWSD